MDEEILKEKAKPVGPNFHYRRPSRDIEAETIPTYLPRMGDLPLE